MNTDDPLLTKELRNDEGVRYSPYLDSVGISTVGVGHNLIAKPLDYTYPLTDEQVDSILANDLDEVFNGLDEHLPWWRNQRYVRQRVIANMAFNMGVQGLMTFKNTLAAIEAGHYQDASNGMLVSKWAAQVHDRAQRLALMMVQG